MLPQQGECQVRIGDRLGADVARGLPVGDLLPVGPGQDPLDRQHLGGPQPGREARAERAR